MAPQPEDLSWRSPAIAIREAAIDDARAMVAYMHDLVGEGLDTIAIRTAPRLEDQREFLERARLADCAAIWLAVEGETVVGLLDVWGGERADGRHLGRIGLSVARDWRGRGIGARLLGAAIDQARTWPDFCRLELECVPWNTPAIRLYERLGFQHEGRRGKGVNLRGRPEYMLMMALTW